MEFTLNPLFSIFDDNDFIYLVHEKYYLKIPNNEPNAFTISILKKGLTYADIKRAADRLNPYLMDYLIKSKATIHSNEPRFIRETKNLGFFMLKSTDPVARMRLIQSKKVAIIGLGGIGTVIIENLIRFGLKNFVLFDPDSVAESDLNRQVLYMAKDINKMKTDVVRDYILDLDASASIVCHRVKITNNDILESMLPSDIDFMIQAADYPLKELNETVNEYCFKNKKSFINSACGLEKGFWGPLIDYQRINEKIRLADFLSEEYSNDELYLNEKLDQPIVYSFGPSNMIIAAHAAADIIAHLSGFEAHSYLCRIFLNTSSLSYHKLNFHERASDRRN